MLVLGRKLGEQIVVPHCELVITVVAIDGNRVRLGISAPPALGVYREELLGRLHQQTHPSPGEEQALPEGSEIADLAP